MATHEKKQKKGVMYVYTLDTGKFKPESNNHPPAPATTKKTIFHTWGHWGVLRRLKTYRENEHNNNNINGGSNQSNHPMVFEESRKSVSVIEDLSRKSVSEIEPRRSSAVNRVEMTVGSVAALAQVKILVTDMPAFMQVHAFRCARQTYDSLEKFSPKHMAYNMKKEFDKVYGPAWHCIVGSSFGSFVTHATGCFLYFSIEKLYILIFKTKVQKTVN